MSLSYQERFLSSSAGKSQKTIAHMTPDTNYELSPPFNTMTPGQPTRLLVIFVRLKERHCHLRLPEVKWVHHHDPRNPNG